MNSLRELFLANIRLIFLIILAVIFFHPVILNGMIPIPADTIVGMYHPWRDRIWNGKTSGVPYKNFLVTDPVRQQYVWRKQAISDIGMGSLPVWNPYSFSGTPLLANFQSGVYYPLNILFFILPFDIAWTILVIVQPLLGSMLIYFYLRKMMVSGAPALLAGISFAYGGFSIAWLEWNTIVQTAMWLPLIMLAKEFLLNKITWKWSLVLIFAELSMFFAGHLQVYFYAFVISNIYLIVRLIQLKKNKNLLREYLPFLIIGLVFLVVSAIQWIPSLQLIFNSARDGDQSGYLKDGWFIPWQNLIMFIAPDFFGNPSTGNYFGSWNYGEFIGFTGIVPLVLALYALVFQKSRKVLFFGSLVFISLIMALPNVFSRLPYILKIPLISTSQPTRLIYVIDFALAVLSALGWEQLISDRKRQKLAVILIGLTLVIFLLWLFVLTNNSFGNIFSPENILTAKRNLVLPTISFMIASTLLFLLIKSRGKYQAVLSVMLILLTVLELFRFGWKFTPFSPPEYIFPQTQAIEFLRSQPGNYRIQSLDRRIMPPNFSAMYRLSDVSGYDPLYLKKYNQLVSSWERGGPDIRLSAFNRIVTPLNHSGFLSDLLGVKYLLSYGPLDDKKYRGKEVFSEGNTFIYENPAVFPRVFMTEGLVSVSSDQAAVVKMYEEKENLQRIGVVLAGPEVKPNPLEESESAAIEIYSPNRVVIRAVTNYPRMVILTDMNYPVWRAWVDGIRTRIYEVDFAFRGVLVPAGEHIIEYRTSLI